MKTNETSAFSILSKIDCGEHIEKKGNLSYLSWAWAWQIVKSNFSDAFYTIYENANGIPYFTDGRTCWVKTGVTIQGLEHIEYLPIMDYSNRSIPADKVTSMDMNKALQRSLTKACARHGLGLYIYAGEDLPEGVEPPYKPVSEDNMRAMAAKYATGVRSKTGEDYRTAWMRFTNAKPEHVAQFDEMVMQYRMNNNLH